MMMTHSSHSHATLENVFIRVVFRLLCNSVETENRLHFDSLLICGGNGLLRQAAAAAASSSSRGSSSRAKCCSSCGCSGEALSV